MLTQIFDSSIKKSAINYINEVRSSVVAFHSHCAAFRQHDGRKPEFHRGDQRSCTESFRESAWSTSEHQFFESDVAVVPGQSQVSRNFKWSENWKPITTQSIYLYFSYSGVSKRWFKHMTMDINHSLWVLWGLARLN